MRILWVKADKLLPVNNGGNIRSYHLHIALQRTTSSLFAPFYGGAPDYAYERKLKEHLPRGGDLVHRQAATAVVTAELDYPFGCRCRRPMLSAGSRSPAVQSPLRSWFRTAAV